MKWSIDKKTTVGLGAILSALIGLGIFSYKQLLTLKSSTEMVKHTHVVIEDIDELVSYLKDAETGQRGYLLTGNPRYLQPYKTAIANIDANFQRIQTLTWRIPQQQQHLSTLKPLITGKLAELKRTIDLYDTQGLAAALAVVNTGQGNRLMEDIRDVVWQMEQLELELLAMRSQVEQVNARQASLLVTSNLLLAGLLGLVILQLNQDISRRQQLETELQNSEQRFRALCEATFEGVWIETSGKIVEANQALAGMFGYELYEIIGKPVQDLFTPETQTQVINHTETGIYEAMGNKKDGTTFPVELMGKPSTYKGDQVWVSAARDISQRQQAERALIESEKQYRLLANSIHQVILVFNPNGEPEFTNQRWLDYSGLTLQQLAQSGWESVIHPDDLETYQAEWEDALGSGQPYQHEFRLRRADGVYRWHLSHAVPLQNSQAEIWQWIVTVTDIDDRKQVEQALEKQTQDLAQANKFKDEFLGIVSHELRTPLNAILGWSNLLRTRNLDAAKTAIGLETIERNAKVQIQLIDDLLNISRLISGKIRLNLRPCDLGLVVNTSVSKIQPSAQAKQIHISTHLPPDAVLVLGDSDRLEQIIGNLLSNAIKFTPTGGQVEIRLTQKHNVAEIQVRDTGNGIDSDVLPHIFERFRQADSSITRQYGGLGMGLAIVRQLVDLHQGHVYADSPRQGEGATFTVELPLLATPALNSSVSGDKNSRDRQRRDFAHRINCIY